MSEASSNVSAFRATLEAAISEGQIGREELIEKVKVMPVERMAELPLSAVAMLGPAALAEIARTRIETDDELKKLRPKPEEPIDGDPEKPAKASLRLHPLERAGLMAVAILGLGLLGDLARPWITARLDPGTRPVSTATWPKCRRLDGYADGCLYVTGSDSLTLEDAATFLHMPTADLAAVNRHLRTSPTARLPAGITLIVWRGTMTLKGSAR